MYVNHRAIICGRAVAAGVLALILAACSSGPVGPGPGQVGELYYQAVMAGDFDAAAGLFAMEVSREAVIAELEARRRQLGTLESYRMTDLVSYTASGGIRYTLRFVTSYSNGHATEGLMLFQASDDNLVRILENNLQ